MLDCHKSLGDLSCPNCTKKLRVMNTAENKETGGIDFIGHCEHCCHQDWQWRRDADGNLHDILRYFFG